MVSALGLLCNSCYLPVSGSGVDETWHDGRSYDKDLEGVWLTGSSTGYRLFTHLSDSV